MSVAGQFLPGWLSLLLWALCGTTCLLALRFADWRALRRVPARVHLVLGGVLFCVLLWSLSVRVIEGLSVHLLGMTTLTLILGWRFAILAGTLALGIHALVTGLPVAALAATWLLTVAVPATVSRGLVYLLRRVRSRNLFIYMLGAGFGGGLLSALAVAIAALLLLVAMGRGEWAAEALANLPLLPLIMFPEGFINGMVVTTLTVFYPDAVKTFDDRYYLDGK